MLSVGLLKRGQAGASLIVKGARATPLAHPHAATKPALFWACPIGTLPSAGLGEARAGVFVYGLNIEKIRSRPQGLKVAYDTGTEKVMSHGVM